LTRITGLSSVWIALIVAVALDTLVQVIWKLAAIGGAQSANDFGALWNIAKQPLFWVLLPLFFAQFANWMYVLCKTDLSYAQPATALSYVTIAFCSATILHEHLTGPRVLGITVIVAGVWLLGSTQAPSGSPKLRGVRSSDAAI